MPQTNPPVHEAPGHPVPLRMGDGVTKARRAALSHYYVAPLDPDAGSQGESDETTLPRQARMVDQGLLQHEVDPEPVVYLEICLKDSQGRRIPVGEVAIPEGGSDLWSGWIIGERENGSPLVVVSCVGSETFDAE